MITWTDERVELLTKLWLAGRSASQIAAEIGCGLTRNAVMGKVARLGLSGLDRVAYAPASQPATPAAAPAAPAPRPRASAAPPVVTPAPVAGPVTIMDLRDSMCRCPLGDPGSETFRYCGGRAVPNGAGAFVYCEQHTRLAYQASTFRGRAPHTTRITAAA